MTKWASARIRINPDGTFNKYDRWRLKLLLIYQGIHLWWKEVKPDE